MTKVITYGTYDLLHYGHIRILKRAKQLGDYLIVGITSDDFDRMRGKINVQQSLMERIKSVKATGIADEIIVEEYEGQKIDDIRRYGIDIFTVGSDWVGKFDYLKEYCKVVYLDRTEGISSSDLRSKRRKIHLGLVGDEEIQVLEKYLNESTYVNGIKVAGICTKNKIVSQIMKENFVSITSEYSNLLEYCDAVYILSHPKEHYHQIKAALMKNKHVLCESPIALTKQEADELFEMAEKKKLILMDAIKTAYSTAYYRLLLLLKSGCIGKIVSVDATCTSIRKVESKDISCVWNSICAWGPTAMLPILQILGNDYNAIHMTTYFIDDKKDYDGFTKIEFCYPNSTASMKVGRGIKSEGILVISGTEGYIYVPAPWWKTDYFEIRYENQSENRRYFYQLDGEGIRYELIAFAESIATGRNGTYIESEVSKHICGIIEKFYKREHLNTINII